MYAVIRAGGKQFRVAPGDVIRVDQKPAENGNIEFTDVLAVSGEPGALVRPQSGARVVGSVVEEGRGDKILVFHFKRKKQSRSCKDIASPSPPSASPRSPSTARSSPRPISPRRSPKRKRKKWPASKPSKRQKRRAAPEPKAKRQRAAKAGRTKALHAPRKDP